MKKAVVMILMVTLVSVTMVSAQRHKRFDRDTPEYGGKGNPLLSVSWERVIEIAEDAGLNSDQLQAIENARNILQNADKNIMAELGDLRKQLHDVMIQTNPEYLQSALEISEKMSEMRSMIHQNKIQAEFELKRILTPEQQTQIRETIREHRREKAEERHEKGRNKMGQERPMERENRKHRRN